MSPADQEGNGAGETASGDSPEEELAALESDVEDALAVAQRERDEYLDMVRRVQADFENYKKRMLRQQTDTLERASESMVVKLLPVLDAFDLAAEHLSSEGSSEGKDLLQAAALLWDTLAKEGLERIGATGDVFDPLNHDAVEHEPAVGTEGNGTDGVPSPTQEPVVSGVLRTGYRFKGRVVRPAMVRVRG